MQKIGGILGRSAFGPLHELALKVQRCVGRLEPLLEALVADDLTALRQSAEEIRRLEHEADEIKREIRISLSTSLFASVARGEVILLVKAMDNIADACERLANLLTIRHTRLPAELAGSLRELRRSVMETVAELVQVTSLLREAEEQPPDARQAATLLEALEKVAAREAEADRREHEFLAALFAIEEKQPTFDVIFLLRSAETLGRVAKEAQNTADVLQRMVLSR